MSHFFRALLHVLFHLGYFGPFVMGVMDSSFLFLPVGNDLLVIFLIARHHQGYLIYVLSAAIGATVGVFLLDMAARRIGEQGVQKMAGPKKWDKLKSKIGTRGAGAIAVACLAPPPFPFTMVVATVCALDYPRWKVLTTVFVSRLVRFLILGYLALRFGTVISSVIKSPAFKWTMIGFAAICVVGSVFSIMKWVRGDKSRHATAPAAA